MALSGSFNSNSYGNPLKASPGFQRDYSTMETSVVAVSGVSLHTNLIPSSLTHDTYIWGLSITSNSFSTVLAIVLQDNTGLEIMSGTARDTGGFVHTFILPIKIGKDLSIDFLVLQSVGTANEKVTIFYTKELSN